MAGRAAIVTGASSGIGLAIARVLGEEGYGLTVAARRPEKLAGAADELRAAGFEVVDVAGNLGDEETIGRVVAAHRDRFGRLDVLVNNAGVGVGQPVGELTTKALDLQIGLNLRSIPLFYRECVDMLKAAGAEHRNAHVFNTASLSGKQGEAWLAVYSATKFGVVGYTQAMNRELAALGIKSCALCPAFVDTPMSDFVKGQVPPESMIQVSDVAEMVRATLRLTPGCLVPEIVFLQPALLAGAVPSA